MLVSEKGTVLLTILLCYILLLNCINQYEMCFLCICRAKSCIKKDIMISEFFLCNIGIRQGDTLSQLLFALFINDFNIYITPAYRDPNIVQSCYPSINDEDIVLLKLFVLLYADDRITLAENELQLVLNKVHQCCLMYKLSVNICG